MRSIITMMFFTIFYIFSMPAAAQTTAPGKLVRLSIDEPASARAKPLKIDFTEIQREADSSIIEINLISGSSVASSMFILKGMCTVMKSRSERFFQSKQIEKNPIRYRITFPKRALNTAPGDEAEKIFSVQECQMFGF
jgi:hypothetical protein